MGNRKTNNSFFKDQKIQHLAVGNGHTIVLSGNFLKSIFLNLNLLKKAMSFMVLVQTDVGN